MMNDRAVLVTGGTMGIGLATGVEMGRLGADVTLTYKWGTADLDSVRARFRSAGAKEPDLVEADAAVPEDTAMVLERIRARGHQRLHAFVSNVSFAALVRSIDAYDERALDRSIGYSTWPLVTHIREAKRIFGRYPRHVVGLSSGGPDHYYKDYDFVAATKAVLETLTRYLAYRLFDEDCRINVVRSRLVRTQSLRETFGPDFEAFVERFNMDRQFISREEVAGVIVALASGMLDGMNGQVLMVDRGTTFFDNLMRIYEERDQLDLEAHKETER
jgi:NAD(P)-dependent dehydrogenase (short-subunit alcohol dehydrogenase family)